MAAQLSRPERVGIQVEGQASAPEDRARGARWEADADVQLLLAFQNGDPRCFDQLFQKYKGAMINFAYRFTGRRDLAEELAQDVFVKCYLAAATYRPEATFATWLFRIARNHCLNELRRASHRAAHEPIDRQDRASPGATPEAEAQARALERRLQAALQAMPERQRTALILSRFHDMSYEDVAATMETSVSSVKSLLVRAKEYLLAHLQRSGGLDHDL